MNLNGIFFLLLSTETTVFLVYQLSKDLSVGWFENPSLGEMLILVGLVSLVAAFYWLTYKYFCNNYSSNIEKYFVPHARKIKLISAISLMIFGMILMLIFPITSETPGVINLVRKNNEIAIFLCFALIEFLFLVLYSTVPKIRIILIKMGVFINKNAIWLIFTVLVFVKIFLLYPISRGLLNLNDAFDYWKMANQIFHGSLDIAQNHKYPPLYPILLSPVFLFGPLKSLQHISIINAIISSTTAFPLYLLTRKYLQRSVSLIFVILCVTFPFHIVYPGIPYSENLYYPLFYWVLYFGISNSKSLKLAKVWDALFAITLTALWLTRYMTLTLIPIFLVIWYLKPESGNFDYVMHFTKTKITKLILIMFFMISIYSIWIVQGINAGIDIKSMIGFASAETGNPNTFTITRLIYWGSISAAYSFLLAAPVLHILFSTLFSLRKIKWRTEIGRLILSLSMITGMLMLIVTLYSWQASFNYPEPGKFVGRYIIYIAVLAWLVAAIILNEKIHFDRPHLIFSSILAIALILFSYGIFINQSRIIKYSIINIRFIDVFSITFMKWIYLLIVIGSLVVSTILLIREKINATILVITACILCINIVSWPFYLERIESSVVRAKNLDALISSAITQTKINNNFVLYVSDGYKFYPKELQVRGYSIEEFEVRRFRNEIIFNNNCKVNMLIEVEGQNLAIIEPSDECNPFIENTLSSYVFNKTIYSVVETHGDGIKK